MQNMDWYHSLNKPFLQPPGYIFGPVWMFLYFTILLSLIIFLRTGITKDKMLPFFFFVVQMVLNFTWKACFFGFRDILDAFIIIVFMWIFIILTIITFYKHSKLAAILLVPYLLWTTFAGYLNFEIARLN